MKKNVVDNKEKSCCRQQVKLSKNPSINSVKLHCFSNHLTEYTVNVLLEISYATDTILFFECIDSFLQTSGELLTFEDIFI
jgi:hypothetical protein